MPKPPNEPHVPEVMFLPLAASAGDGWGDLDRGVFARRVPDFVHHLLNQGQPGPTAILELQTAADPGPVTWMQLDAVPDRDDAFELLPRGLDVRALIAGEIMPVEGGLRLEFHVFRAEDEEEFVTAKVAGVVHLQDPVAGLLRLARHLARALELPFREPPRGLLTANGTAFCRFLQGLDNAMLLSGDLEISLPDDPEALMRPFAEALSLDPAFGLALRVANVTTAIALDGARLSPEAVHRFLDRCHSAQPFDGEACVAVAEQLVEMGQDQRAFDWLEHAARLDPPPPRGLENLGILMARRGDATAARELWQRGIELDGHPDFFSHLAQLAFAEDREAEAWDLELRGLRRLRERAARAAEWDDHERGAGVLLECLHLHLSSREHPAAVVAALLDLAMLLAGDDQVSLGLCLHACGRAVDARRELVSGLRTAALDLELRDRAVRALLQIDVTGFEERFAKAADGAQRGRNPRACLADLQLWLQLQGEFWPALFFSAVAKRRLGESDEALDLLAMALEVAPGQPDVLHEMGRLFAARQNPKRALELTEKALAERPAEARFHAAKVSYLLRLGRDDEAVTSWKAAIEQCRGDEDLRRIGRQLRRRRR